jgi:hypothetical protein
MKKTKTKPKNAIIFAQQAVTFQNLLEENSNLRVETLPNDVNWFKNKTFAKLNQRLTPKNNYIQFV